MRSGPAGEDPTGTIRWFDNDGLSRVLEVTCLYVSGNIAIIGVSGRALFADFVIPLAGLLRVTDGGAPDSAEDSFEAAFQVGSDGDPPIPGPTDCSTFPTGRFALVNAKGDLTVRDAVGDTTAPLLNVPSGITVNATSLAGAQVIYTVSATDNLDPTPDVTCNPPLGSTFPIGTTKVTCTATDDTGNQTSKSFNVVVRLPTSKEECKHGGWRNFGSIFKNQGDCVSFVATGGKNPPGTTTP